jgi:hypothetical protein
MVRLIAGIAVLLYCAIGVLAETVTLKGTVKNASGVGIAGVKVSLTKLSTLSVMTVTDGSFGFGPMAIMEPQVKQAVSMRFFLKNNTIVFSPTPQALSGSVAMFSSDGKLLTSLRFKNLTAGKQLVSIPEFHSGITVLRLSINGKSFTRTVISLGNKLFLKQESQSGNAEGAFMLAKNSATSMVDTLKAEKTGYITKNTGIENYTKENIAITLDTNNGIPGACTRDALQAMVDKYVEAQKAGDPTKMPLSSDVKYTQNMKATTAEKCIVKTALPTIASTRTFLDVDSCRTFTEMIITAGGHPYVIGTRLKVNNDKISEVNTMVTDTLDWNFSATSYLNFSKSEIWDTLPVDQRGNRQIFINACNAYFDKIFDWSKDTIPWGDECYRIEGGKAPLAKPCSQGTEGNSVKTTCRTYVVDTVKGAINIYCYFGYGPDSHLFRLVNKKIVYIHTMTACGDTVPGNECWGTAAKGKAKGFCDWYSK